MGAITFHDALKKWPNVTPESVNHGLGEYYVGDYGTLSRFSENYSAKRWALFLAPPLPWVALDCR